MKVNIVVPSTVLGGGIKVIFQYANYLTKKGHDVVVYVPMLAFGIKKKYNFRTSLANTFKRGTKVKWMECAFKIRLALKIEDRYIRNADIVIATAWYTAPSVNYLSEEKGAKVYFIQDYEVWNQDENIVNATYKMEMNRIVTTKKLHDILSNKLGVDSTIVYNGHKDTEFFYGDKKIQPFKTIMMLWNPSWYKGGYQAIEILKRMYEKHKIKIVFFGIYKRPDIPDYFNYYLNPERDDLIKLYQSSDIYLFPSNQEAWGLPVIEAMANKCAVVGMNTGCLGDVCENRKHALIAECGNYTELEEKLEELLGDDLLIDKLQKNGYDFSLNFSLEKQSLIFENCLLLYSKK